MRMVMKVRLLLLVVVSAGSCTGRAWPADGISGIVIDTDRSVNCATLETIVADVSEGCETEQDKAIALYNFMVRTCWMSWHSHRPLEIQYSGKHKGELLFVNDPLKYINVYGYLGCGPQAGVLCSLMEAAGIESRMLNPGFGHVSCEFHWDGSWHWLDPWLPAYVLNRKGEIASYEEIMADRDLFIRAREEGRAPGNFMVNWEADKNTVLGAENWKAGSRDPYPEKYVENLCLRPGEKCTWLWGNVGKWYNPAGPYLGKHLMGQYPAGPSAKFGNDEVLKDAFPYWEPYKRIIKNGSHPWSDTYYRYYGNAVFEHAPPLTARGMDDIGARLENVVLPDEGGLMVHNVPAGEVQMTFELPYVIADTEIEGTAEMDVGGGISFLFSTDGGETWLLGEEVRQAGKFGPVSIGKPNTYEFPAGSTSGRYGFDLRIVIRCNWRRKPTLLKALKITNTTMLNFYSRPWLETGTNNVTATAANPSALAETPLPVTWRWLEDWDGEKSFTHTIAVNGSTCAVEVGGSKRLKMESVTIACPSR